MKKIITTIVIVLGLCLTSFADPNGGMFGRGETNNREGNELFAPKLPNHGMGTNQPAPVGSGIIVLTALGSVYLVGKRRKED